MATAINTVSAGIATCGRSPSVAALRGSNVTATNARCPITTAMNVTASATARTTRSLVRTANTSPNRKPVRSTAKLCDRETMMTPSASVPTSRRPMLASDASFDDRPISATPSAMASAARRPPTIRLPPSKAATATPGSMPCVIASPRKTLWRSRTQHPTTAHRHAAIIPATRARTTTSASNGSINNCMAYTSSSNESHFQ